MANEGLDGLEGNASVEVPKKKSVLGLLPNILKMVLIAIGAIIVIVVTVVITMKIMKGNEPNPPTIPVSEDLSVQREVLDWYQSLGEIKTKTRDEIPASVIVNLVLGYKKDDKATSAEITSRTVELKDFLRRFFALKSTGELKPEHEDALKIELRNAINDEILSNTKIKDVKFLQLDVIEQN